MEETLATAARRALRNFEICMQHGGLVDRDLEQSMLTLRKQLEKEDKKAKRNVQNS